MSRAASVLNAMNSFGGMEYLVAQVKGCLFQLPFSPDVVVILLLMASTISCSNTSVD